MAKEAAEAKTIKDLTDAAKTAPAPAPTAEGSKRKKLAKEIKGTVITITEGITHKVLIFDFAELPADIQAKLGPFGLGHKLGDAAAGKEGAEAVESIEKVWKGLMEDDWTVRAPAGEKISKTDLTAKVSALSPAEQEATKALLAKLGITL